MAAETPRKRRAVFTTLLLAALALLGLSATVGRADAAPAGVGQASWEPVANWPLIPIHMALDSRGRVVSYGTNGDGRQTGRFIYDVWDPQGAADQNHSTLNNTTNTDLFCSLQINRPDTGDMLLFGGDIWNGSSTINDGNDDINLYRADSSTLTELPGMKRRRWYGTGTTLIDGSIYVQGGDFGTDRPERWTADRGSELLSRLDTNAFDYWYPRNWVTPDGRIFGFDGNYEMYTISPDLQNLTRHGRLSPRSDWGRSMTAVMFEPGRILYLGGTTRSAAVIDITGPEPVVTQTASTFRQRSWGNATLLPDGRVLATGGANRPSDIFKNDPLGNFDVAYGAEIWDPATGQWTTQPQASRARLYHSAALLLPDGRVLTGGGGAPGPVNNTDAEIFRPDYLTRADGSEATRPSVAVFGNGPRQAGDTLNLGVTHTRSIDRMTLIKTGSVTHSFDMEQRFIELPFSGGNGSFSATLPSSGNVMTPGFYHLFVLDDLGVPSVAQMVHVKPSASLPEPLPEIGQTAGGNGGDPFRDSPLRGTTLTGINVWSDSNWVRGIQAVTSDGALGRHGIIGRDLNQVTLNDGEYVTAIFGKAGDFVDSLGFETSTGRTIGPFGGGGGSPFRIAAPDGYQVVGFKGRYGTIIDRIGIVVDEAPTEPPPDPTVGGRVVDSDGQPVAGVQVDLFSSNNGGDRLNYRSSLVTGADGRYRFEVPPGCWAVTFVSPAGREFTGGGQYSNRAGCVEAGQQLDNLDAELAASNSASGQIEGQVSSGSSPVSNVSIDLFTATADGSRGSWIRSTTTGSDGRYSFDVDPACHVVTFIAPTGRTFTNGSQWLNRTACTDSGEIDVLDAALVPQGGVQTLITGRVDDQGGGVAGVAVDLFTANADGSRGTWIKSTATNSNGDFQFDTEPGCGVLTFIAPTGRTFTNGSRWLNLGVCVEEGQISSGNDAGLS